ncbi:dTDP-4-dehydrorhamnose reductase [Jiangella sp. DSM 45060]|uniref:dTDP-4-dehydrorhamnose reductase n=1 Tax=Jiangella sp. DSM 45060 TaxID=1798224 RepID=UPI00087D7772|nr:dTDP-4-dehydrorhamnose reductase [Jiangella sp. DSM 45060]SDT50672.1 dTDP-4-dehydrorhamnose reductase [Jiangella sp. DSM 45060]
MLTILVPGGTGQVGTALARGTDADVDVIAPGSRELDVRDHRAVANAVGELAGHASRRGRLPLVINAAADTDVVTAEVDPARAFAVNAQGAATVAEACASCAVPLVHISTDQVFAGDVELPYRPEDDRRPRNEYGRSKAAGEDAVLGSGARSWIVRTSWLYGARGSGIVPTTLRRAAGTGDVTVLEDRCGSPTWAADLAAALTELAWEIAYSAGPSLRLLHCTNAGHTTPHGFTRALFEEVGADPGRVRTRTPVGHPSPAQRPGYSVLSNRSWVASGLTPMRSWRDALHACVEQAVAITG